MFNSQYHHSNNEKVSDYLSVYVILRQNMDINCHKIMHNFLAAAFLMVCALKLNSAVLKVYIIYNMHFSQCPSLSVCYFLQ